MAKEIKATHTQQQQTLKKLELIYLIAARKEHNMTTRSMTRKARRLAVCKARRLAVCKNALLKLVEDIFGEMDFETEI